ncbi:OmpP1/FadL family transporter [Treponema sp. C6A8]|uniref:OmpP1/FadL family transporter n=1 Tax=Treponema sp. C6A8 TaxID=1410609 RepID=UPI003527EF7F
MGLAYNLFDLISLSAAVRFLQGDQKLTLESPYFNAISGEGNEVSCKSFAFGVSPVFGAHVRLFEKLDLAAQLQVITKMKYEVNSVTGKKIAAQIGDNGITEDTTFHSDIPTVLNLGLGYRVIEPLYLSTSFNYYFNKSADCDSVIGTNSYDDSFEIALGADYKINDFVLVSGGFAYGKQGTTSSANNVFNPILDSFQIGFGAEIKPIKILTITAGGTWVKYFDTTYTKSGYDIDLSKKLFMFSVGASLKLF